MKKSDERMIIEIGAILNDMGMNPKLKGFRYWIMIIFLDIISDIITQFYFFCKNAYLLSKLRIVYQMLVDKNL